MKQLGHLVVLRRVIRGFVSRCDFDLFARNFVERRPCGELGALYVEFLELAVDGARDEGDELVMGERLLGADHVKAELL